jgi:hypothetical protein
MRDGRGILPAEHGGLQQTPVRYPVNSKPHVPAGVQKMVELTMHVVVPAHVLIRHLEGESVLLNLGSERYFGLDATGTRMWELMTSQPCIALALEKLQEEYEVEPETLRAHLTELLSRLVENGLLQVLPADVGTTSTI